MTLTPENRKYFFDFVVMALCLVGLFIAFEFRSFVYFRDYAITFEGAYRLFLGQVPYRDFGTPVGPVSFLIPALFFKLFAPNWGVFLLSQVFQNTSMLLLVYALLARIGSTAPLRRITLVTYSGFYLLCLTHPWYNSTGSLLLFAGALCALCSGRVMILIAGLTSGLAVLAKQDFGLLTLLVASILVALVSLGSDRDKILPGLDSLRDIQRLRTMAINLLLLVIATIAGVAIFILLTDAEQFRYWFNYGQEPHNMRSISMWDLLSRGKLGFLLAIVALVSNNFRLLVASMFFIAAAVSSSTSGLSFTHNYFVAFVPLVIDETLRLKIRFKSVIVLAVLAGSLRIMIQPTKNAYFVFESAALHKPEDSFFNYRNLSEPLVRFPRELKAFSPSMQAPQETIDAIINLKRIVAEKRAAANATKLKVLNISELTPIYAELNIDPPRGFPLWFDSKVSLFPQEITQLNRLFSGQEFDIILLQGTHEGLTEPYKHFLSTLNANGRYELLKDIQGSPANAPSPCKPYCQGDIYIYVKHPEFSLKRSLNSPNSLLF